MDKRELLRENPKPYIGQLYTTFIKNNEKGIAESIRTNGTACLIQLEELSSVIEAN